MMAAKPSTTRLLTLFVALWSVIVQDLGTAVEGYIASDATSVHSPVPCDFCGRTVIEQVQAGKENRSCFRSAATLKRSIRFQGMAGKAPGCDDGCGPLVEFPERSAATRH